MTNGRMLFISEQECHQLLTQEKVLDLLEEVQKEYAKGTAMLPIKLHMPLQPYVDGYMNLMPSYLREHDVYGCKVGGCFNGNVAMGLPTSLGVVMLYNPENGIPFALMPDIPITMLRTGGMAGVASGALSRKDSKIFTVVGAGAMGRTGCDSVLNRTHSIEEVRILEVNPKTLEDFLAFIQPKYPNVKFVHYTDVQKACGDADVIHAAHNAPMPLVPTCKLKPGVHVIITAERDVTEDWIKKTFDYSVTDFADCLVTRHNVGAEHAQKIYGTPYVPLTATFSSAGIGEVLAGLKPGRVSGDQKILSWFVGMSIEDVICGKEIYDNAVKNHMGVELPLFQM